MLRRKIDLMHDLFGKIEDQKCRDCNNLACGTYHDKTLRKCRVYGLTHSEASDWRLKYTACGMFNREFSGPPIIKRIRQFGKVVPVQLDGQIEMEG